VESLLEEVGVAATPRLRVWNKIDLLEPGERERLPRGATRIAVSARTGEGLDTLRLRIAYTVTPQQPWEAQGRPFSGAVGYVGG